MPKEQLSLKGKFNYKLVGWKQSLGVRAVLFVLMGVLFYVALSYHVLPKTYDFTLNEPSNQTIFAPSQRENSHETLKEKEKAEKQVQPVYRIVSMRNEQLVESIFARLLQINSDEEMRMEDKTSLYRTVIPALFQDFYDDFLRTLERSGSYSEPLLAEIRTQLLDEQYYRVPEEFYFKLARLTKEDLTDMEPVTKDIVRRIMSDQIDEAQTARAKVSEMVNASQLTKVTTREMVQEIARFALTPNRFYDKKATDDARAQAWDNVKPVYINKNDLIVEKGQIVDEDVYRILNYYFESADSSVSHWRQLGLLIMVSLFVFIVYMFIRQGPVKMSNVHLCMLLLIFILNLLGMKIVALGQNLDYPYVGFLAPVAMGSLLIAILLDAHLAFITSILFSIFASIIFNVDPEQLFDFRFGFVAAVISFAAVFTIQRAGQRSTILKAGIMVSLFACASILALVLLEDSFTTMEVLYSLAFAFSGGILTAVFVLGVMPFFEVSFGILSPLKLVELSNPNHPLLRKLLTETPGTYHHSVMVGNLSEAAAESIGANGLLCRVGSFYHDVGKTKRPSYFIENQMNIENPHDRIEPSLSKSIIIAHASDGVEMLSEHRIPKPIRDIAEQHHGTTLLKYFYHKALKQAEADGEPPATEEEYRYPGPKAQTKEAAIVGIADCVEAAVRSLRNPSVEQIDSMVKSIIKNRLDDNQFNECDLTMKELDIIHRSMKETLLGIFHSRIEYPTDLPKPSSDRQRSGTEGA